MLVGGSAAKCAGLGGGSPPRRGRGWEGALASKEEADLAVRSVVSVSLPEDATAAAEI